MQFHQFPTGNVLDGSDHDVNTSPTTKLNRLISSLYSREETWSSFGRCYEHHWDVTRASCMPLLRHSTLTRWFFNHWWFFRKRKHASLVALPNWGYSTFVKFVFSYHNFHSTLNQITYFGLSYSSIGFFSCSCAFSWSRYIGPILESNLQCSHHPYLSLESTSPSERSHW